MEVLIPHPVLLSTTCILHPTILSNLSIQRCNPYTIKVDNMPVVIVMLDIMAILGLVTIIAIIISFRV
mgnify:CR=1 FL=1